MFWGHEIKSNQGQAKPVMFENDIKLSQAVIDPKSYKQEPVTLMVEYNKKQFILAVIDPSQAWQCPLDIMFAAGSEVKFFTRGPGTVHLTGFEMHDDLDEDFDMSMSSDEDEEEELAAAGGDSLKALNKLHAKTPPKVNGVKQQNGTGKKESAKKELTVAGGSAKKESAKKKPEASARLPVANQADDDSDDDSLDDEDFDLDDLDSDEEMDDSDESNIGEHDIDDEDDDDDDDDLDDEDLDDDDDDEELDDEESD